MDPNTAERDLSYYFPLYQAASEGNWNAAREFIERDRNALTATITYGRMTMLHVAAQYAHSEFVEKLVEILPAESLNASDDNGDNALHYVARYGTVQSARRMVDKKPNLPQSYNFEQKTPLYAAAVEGRQSPEARKRMVWFLLKVTSDEALAFALTGDNAGELIVEITNSGFYDITLSLLERYASLAAETFRGRTVLHGLAEDRSSFQEGSKLANFKRLIYRSTSPFNNGLPLCSQRAMPVRIRFRGELPIEITRLVCKHVRRMDLERRVQFIDDCLVGALHVAIMNGVIEMVQVCLEYLPNLIWISSNDRTLLHVAIEYRQWKIYNYLIELAGEKKYRYAYFKPPLETGNILHFAARIPSIGNLQMQRELQWFKEVEKLVDKKLKSQRDKDRRTPKEVFTYEHERLLGNEEKWMKSTSEACMVVATLVASIVFAAIITVPGGSKDGTGVPNFVGTNLFLSYAGSATVALISSMISLLTSLLIRTSRFSEEEFLDKLPRELMVSLTSLHVAIIAMTIAFAAALLLALGLSSGWASLISFPLIFFPLLSSTMRLLSRPL